MRIDCHTHAFADKIADKAVAQLINYYHIQTDFGGKLGDLLSVAVEAGLDAVVLLVAATKPEQVKPANDWILDVARLSPAELERLSGLARVPRIIPFGTFHPGDPNWPAEIARLRAAGFKGIKLHPEFQGIDLADPALEPFFEEVCSDFVLMVHMGDPVKTAANFSTPRKLAAILDRFPKLRAIAAHMGGYCFWEEALADLAGRDVYLDTSSTLSYIDRGLLRRLIDRHGTEKILFGSDYPLKSPRQELELLAELDWLSDGDRERILGLNCAELLGIASGK
ncbi:hypothetical protein EDC14_102933 [Hydrogenispora ethanolica]|uniref:Amidohydrolase-related domain-containing protein n=1 Tax=Hydrogenispora ethanolica TaxID=1082276 RepID=A0A4R1R8L4_HYDET|nr:amidohydrolase family protein [Hydrogenispora ethanolica]TCL62004.1 hypothetical protein EDC14_102933 [Hydrogenispora ethanolica]